MNPRSTSQQQQPAGDRLAQQQQMAGSNEFQKQGQPGEQQGSPQQGGAGKPQQMGEGSYEGARDYKERTERYVKNADVEADAEKAKPRSEQEAREMKQAEEEGKSHAKGED
ncbi:hypothetical protein [Ramlibacter sp. Leaf400]|uniref:hypothetical protein n=1 Tax=Ramlibacter sp. Leaf400 TaxID=1736365 RepID=UPI0007003380|nr:hypothetical protein [Ramlibacter sp. Leaf400]KQT09428.1 hypothetical protein ASG30_12715 [Ramlibacter sp. Leaf400]